MSPSRVYQATGSTLSLLARGDGSTGPDDGMAQLQFSPPSSGYGDQLYVCAASTDAGDGVFTLSAAGTFSVFKAFNNCNGMMFDVDGRFSVAELDDAMYVNVSATDFGFVSTANDLTLYGPVLPNVSSGYRLVPMRSYTPFGSVVLALDPAGGTLWSTSSIDDASPVQRMMDLDNPRGLAESGGLAFGSGALLSEAGSGRVSMVRSGYQSAPILTGLQGPTALGTPEGVVDAEVWILESGRGRILRLRPTGP